MSRCDGSINQCDSIGERALENFYRLNGSHDKAPRKNCGRTAIKTARCKAFGAQNASIEGVPLKCILMYGDLRPVCAPNCIFPQTHFFLGYNFKRVNKTHLRRKKRNGCSQRTEVITYITSGKCRSLLLRWNRTNYAYYSYRTIAILAVSSLDYSFRTKIAKHYRSQKARLFPFRPPTRQTMVHADQQHILSQGNTHTRLLCLR